MQLPEEIIKDYQSDEAGLKNGIEIEKQAETARKAFVNDFPIEKIQSLPLNEYLFSKKGYGNRASFCNRLNNELNIMAHKGNSYSHVYGIYIEDGTSIKLSSTFQSNSDINKAFEEIKNLVIELLKAGDTLDFNYINTCKLNMIFKCKLLMVYYPTKFLHVCTAAQVKKYCKQLEINIPSKASTIDIQNILLQLKNSTPEFVKWSNSIFVNFCEWLIKKNKSFDIKELQKTNFINDIDNELEALSLTGMDKTAFTKIRVNQSIFRDRLLSRYNKCCLCGVSEPNMLTASHIKPWSHSSPQEKLDTDNGFLFCPNHDRLFDQGWISFNAQGKILISDYLSSDDRIFLNVHQDMTIELTKGNIQYLQFHRDNIFNSKI